MALHVALDVHIRVELRKYPDIRVLIICTADDAAVLQ